MIWNNSESIGTNLDLIKVLMYAIMKLKANEKGKRTPDYQKKKKVFHQGLQKMLKHPVLSRQNNITQFYV